MFEKNGYISDIVAKQNKTASTCRRKSRKATFTDRIIICLIFIFMAAIFTYTFPYKTLYCSVKTNTCTISVRYFYEISANPLFTFNQDNLLRAKLEGHLQNTQEDDESRYNYTISLQTTENTINLFEASNSYIITKYKVDKINNFIKNKDEDLNVSDNVILVWLPTLFLLLILLIVSNKEITISYYPLRKDKKIDINQ